MIGEGGFVVKIRACRIESHFFLLGNTMTINVPMIAHASVPAANQGYRFRYANTRQTVFIHDKFTRSTRITRMASPR